MANVTHANGVISPPQTEKSSGGTPPRVVLAGKTGRILCVADIRGDFHELNRLIKEHEATAVIHTGDFGFLTADSLDRMGDKILRHLLQYSPLLASGTRQQLLDIPATSGRAALIEALNNSSIHFPLSQFPHLLTGAITFPVPVFTVWGLIEDVRVLEKFRTGEYEVHNLNVIDEAASRVIDVGGIRLRLFGLGGAVAPHKMFDNGEGHATIAGGQGTMWTTALQIGELIDTAQRVYDSSETRLFIASAPISRNGLLSQISSAMNVDLTISGGLHFRYAASYNEFSVHGDYEGYRQKLQQSRETFVGVYNSVKDKVDSSLTEPQQALLKKALSVAQKVPDADDHPQWTNTWHWVLSDASCGHLLFSISEGRVSAETKSAGLNFSHRSQHVKAPPSAHANATQATPVPRSTVQPGSSIKPLEPSAAATAAPVAPSITTAARPPIPAPTAPTARPALPGVRPPPAPTTIPPRPPQHQPAINSARPPFNTPTQMGGVRGPLQRGPLPTKPQNPNFNSVTPASSGPAAGAATPAAAPAVRPQGQGINARPVRPPAGPTANSFGQNKVDTPKSDNKPATPSANQARPPAGPKSTPAANGKGAQTPSTEVSSEKKDDKTQATSKAQASKAAEKKDVPSSGKDTPTEKAAPVANGEKGKEKEKKGGAETKDKAEAGKKEGVSAPASSGAATPTEEKGAEAGEEAAGKKKPSLYIKGLPVPVTEEELRSLFPDQSSKITAVKLVHDRPSGRQKNFAYVDFASDEDLQAAMKASSSKIRDVQVTIALSNPPPSRFDSFRGGGGRGRGSFRGAPGGRGGGRGGFSGTKGGNGGEKKEGEKPAATTASGSAAAPAAPKADAPKKE